tara:strand:- start:3746 stop:3994 length:249 start_codon:yes stop_codon:yes gene_type:complete
MMTEVERWVTKELKENKKEMMKYRRKQAHIKYLEMRILELRDSYLNYEFLKSGSFKFHSKSHIKLKADLFIKYNERLKKFNR